MFYQELGIWPHAIWKSLRKWKWNISRTYFSKKKKIILITPWWHTSFLQRGREKTRVACLKSGVIFKGKASFKACLFGTIPLRILDLRYFAFVTTEWMNYLQMNSSAILARTEENMAGLIFLQDNRWPGRLMGSLPNEKKKSACPASSPIIKWRRIWEPRSPNRDAVPSTA